jgi:D-amino-acid dehydrogenase
MVVPMQHVVIAGGGIIGAATAFYLSRRGVRTTVVERRAVASGASGKAAGLLSPPSPVDLREPWGPLARLSLGLHFDVARLLDGRRRYGFEPVDMALVARDESERERIVAIYGTDAWLDRKRLREQCAWPGEGVLGGVVRHSGAQVFPGQLTATLLEAAGARVVAGGVRAIAMHDERAAAGVELDGSALEADAVVLAMGPWSAEASGWLGMPIPVAPLKGQILRLSVPGAPPSGFTDVDGQYLVRKPGGVVYTGTTEEDAGFDETPTPEAEQAILDWARASSPFIANAEVLERTACLRPLSADNVPIIGAVPGMPGAYLATGHGRKGLLLSLGTGKALAELMLDGRASCTDLAPFAPGRFAAGVTA